MKGGRSGQPSYCDAAQGFVSCDGGSCQCSKDRARYEKDGTVTCVGELLCTNQNLQLKRCKHADIVLHIAVLFDSQTVTAVATTARTEKALKCSNGRVCDPSVFAACVDCVCKTRSDLHPSRKYHHTLQCMPYEHD
jgi:hypothetical protein